VTVSGQAIRFSHPRTRLPRHHGPQPVARLPRRL